MADLADFGHFSPEWVVIFADFGPKAHLFCEWVVITLFKKLFSLKLFLPIKDLMMALSITEFDINTK